MLLIFNDKLVDVDEVVVCCEFILLVVNILLICNVVVVLLESFVGYYVGVLGVLGNIMLYFDKLLKEGLLFIQFFFNGIYIYQGMFVIMVCFFNLLGFEYLM